MVMPLRVSWRTPLTDPQARSKVPQAVKLRVSRLIFIALAVNNPAFQNPASWLLRIEATIHTVVNRLVKLDQMGSAFS